MLLNDLGVFPKTPFYIIILQIGKPCFEYFFDFHGPSRGHRIFFHTIFYGISRLGALGPQLEPKEAKVEPMARPHTLATPWDPTSPLEAPMMLIFMPLDMP
jgi:hypothetical protein